MIWNYILIDSLMCIELRNKKQTYDFFFYNTGKNMYSTAILITHKIHARES